MSRDLLLDKVIIDVIQPALPAGNVTLTGNLIVTETLYVGNIAGNSPVTCNDDLIVLGQLTTTGGIPATSGGTGQTTWTTGDILYASATNTLSKLPAAANGQVLTLTLGVPAWQNPATGGGNTIVIANEFCANVKVATDLIEPKTNGNVTLNGNLIVTDTLIFGNGIEIGDISTSTTASSGIAIGKGVSSTASNAIALGNSSSNGLANTAVFAPNGTEVMRLLDPSVGNFTSRVTKSSVPESPAYTFSPTVAQLVGGYITVAPVAASTTPSLSWIRQQPSFNSAGADQQSSIAVDASGNVYCVYTTDGTVSGGTNIGSFDIVIFKLDTNGTTQWVKQLATFNTTGFDAYPTIAVDANGNSYVTYSGGTVSGGTTSGGLDIIVFKMDTNGTLIWTTQQPVFNTASPDLRPSIALDPSSNVYVAYNTGVGGGTVPGGVNTGGSDIVVFKLDINGTFQWSKQTSMFNTTSDDQFTGFVQTSKAIAVDGSGNVYVTYHTLGTVSGGTNLGGFDNVIFKLDTNGNFQWSKQNSMFNTTGSEQYGAIVADYSGNIYITFSTAGTVSGGTASGGADIVVMKMDTNGTTVWIRQNSTFNSAGADTFSKLAIDALGNVYVTYYATGTISGGTLLDTEDIVVFKLDTNGNTLWTKQSQFNTTAWDEFPAIAVTALGEVYVCYETYGVVSGGISAGGGIDIAIFKLANTSPILAIGGTGSSGTDLSTYAQIAGNPYVGLKFKCIVCVTNNNPIPILGSNNVPLNGITPRGDTSATTYPRELIFVNTGTNTWDMIIFQ